MWKAGAKGQGLARTVGKEMVFMAMCMGMQRVVEGEDVAGEKGDPLEEPLLGPGEGEGDEGEEGQAGAAG